MIHHFFRVMVKHIDNILKYLKSSCSLSNKQYREVEAIGLTLDNS